MSCLKATMAALAVAVSASSATAAVVTIFDTVPDGASAFDATVDAAGGTVNVDTWSNLGSGNSVDRGAYTITRNDGGFIFPDNYGGLSGQVVSIAPGGGGSSPRTDPLDYLISGVTLTFDSAVNSIGFEVGDWATCCFEPTTDLFMSFDGGAPILVASADDGSDSPTGASGFKEMFVAAFDDSGSFTSVSFWGNGTGEALYFGGEVRYALLDEGSLPPPAPVPLPASLPLLAGGLLGIAAMRRWRRS